MSTARWNPWATDRYAQARQRGHNHRRALRTVGRARSRILWRCWQTRTPYDPARHTGLQQHITVTIPGPSGSRPDHTATQRTAPNLTPQTPEPRLTQDVFRAQGQTYGKQLLHSILNFVYALAEARLCRADLRLHRIEQRTPRVPPVIIVHTHSSPAASSRRRSRSVNEGFFGANLHTRLPAMKRMASTFTCSPRARCCSATTSTWTPR